MVAAFFDKRNHAQHVHFLCQTCASIKYVIYIVAKPVVHTPSTKMFH